MLLCRPHFTTSLLFLVLLNGVSALAGDPKESTQDPRPQVIATTDGEIDDRCSMIRFLLYANEWNIRGIVHSSSKYHWKGNENVKPQSFEGTEWLDHQLAAYEKIQPNLALHDPRYPTPDRLRSVVYEGNLEYEGDMSEPTPGSNRIVEVLLEEDPAPVWLQAWGGMNTIARALKTIAEEHPDKKEAVAKKAQIFTISLQDKTYQDYIRPEWPEVMFIHSRGDAFGAIAYGWSQFMTPEQKPYFKKDWMLPNILEGHGPLCSMYEAKEQRFRSEGDSPAFMHLIEVGLRSIESPAYGGWGGRFHWDGRKWVSVDKKGEHPHSILRWSIPFQNDWAARADWCVKSLEEANHPPVAKVEGPLDRNASPGEVVELSAAETTDPDGDSLTYRWWQHQEAGDAGEAKIEPSESGENVKVTMPDTRGTTLHLLLEVEDSGDPPLVRWQRVIFEIGE